MLGQLYLLHDITEDALHRERLKAEFIEVLSHELQDASSVARHGGRAKLATRKDQIGGDAAILIDTV